MAASQYSVDLTDRDSDRHANLESEDFSWLTPKKISDLTTVQPEQILRGMLYKGGKAILMGGSKSFKTWTLMDIAYCVSNGLLWWGVHTLETLVIYLDFELLEYDFRWRIEQIQQVYRKQNGSNKHPNLDNIRRIGIRGKSLGDRHWNEIYRMLKDEGAGLVVADPTYKLLGPFRDENKTGDIAQVTALLERITEETGAAEFHSQHFSKGNQASKESIDRGAGSGVWARDADTIITMTKHQEGDDYLSIEATLRSFPRIDPFVVQWNFPLFERRNHLDPADLKQPAKTGGSSAKYSVQDLIDCLGDKDLETAEFEALVIKKTEMSRSTFFNLRKAGEKQGKLHQSKVDGKWEVVQQPRRSYESTNR
jgi:hypothetical protein